MADRPWILSSLVLIPFIVKPYKYNFLISAWNWFNIPETLTSVYSEGTVVFSKNLLNAPRITHTLLVRVSTFTYDHCRGRLSGASFFNFSSENLVVFKIMALFKVSHKKFLTS